MANPGLEHWRHLIEPVISTGLAPVTWEQALQMDTRLLEMDGSILLLLDGDDPDTRTVWVAAGDMKAVREMVPVAEERARADGKKRMVYAGRKGWARAMPDYRVEMVIGVKEL